MFRISTPLTLYAAPQHRGVLRLVVAARSCWRRSEVGRDHRQHRESPIVFAAIINVMIAAIRMQQERTYLDRLRGSDLASSDIAAHGRAFESFRAAAERTESSHEAVDAALTCSVPELLERRAGPEVAGPHVAPAKIRRATRAS